VNTENYTQLFSLSFGQEKYMHSVLIGTEKYLGKIFSLQYKEKALDKKSQSSLFWLIL
jgi:hypothetical protein